MKRHAVAIAMTIFNLTVLVDSASLAFGSPVGSELKEGRQVVVRDLTITRYPQVVDNSDRLRINENKHLWITHAEQLVTLYWGKNQIKAFKTIIYRESRWNPRAYNSATNAYGLGQIINSKSYTKDMPYKQINAAIKYILHRYGTPTKALAHHYKYGWY